MNAPDESCPAPAVAVRLCAPAGGVLRLVHVRACDPPWPIAGRLWVETPGEAAAVLEEVLVMAWACGGLRATTAVVDARRSDVAAAIAWQAAAWPADLIVLTRHPKLAICGLVMGSVPDQVTRKAGCPVLAVPAGRSTGSVRWLRWPSGGDMGGRIPRTGRRRMKRQMAGALRRPILVVASVLAASVAVKGRRAKGAGDETNSDYRCRFGWS